MGFKISRFQIHEEKNRLAETDNFNVIMTWQLLLKIFVYPGQEVRDSRINAWILALAASDSPAHDSYLGPAAVEYHQGTSTVTLEKKTKWCNDTHIIYWNNYLGGKIVEDHLRNRNPSVLYPHKGNCRLFHLERLLRISIYRVSSTRLELLLVAKLLVEVHLF